MPTAGHSSEMYLDLLDYYFHRMVGWAAVLMSFFSILYLGQARYAVTKLTFYLAVA